MLSPRTETILKHIVTQYITRAVPVPSQGIAGDPELAVSSATVRNEMALLEQEGYVTRPHTSAGCVPTDKGYRYYVDSLQNVKLLPDKQRLISHLFHQVEREIENWLSLAATVSAQLAQNVAVVSMPKPVNCRLKHLELVTLRDKVALLVLILHGAKVKQKLINFDQAVTEPGLAAIANKLNAAYSGLTARQIAGREEKLSPAEQKVTDYLIEMLQAEAEQKYGEPFLDGLHYILTQPEFAHSDRMLPLVDLVEQRSLLKFIVPAGLRQRVVQVAIGRENQSEAIHDYSVVITQYGLPDEAVGTIGVVGPTRMPYSSAIPAVDYMATMLSRLVARLYGREEPATGADKKGTGTE